MIIPTTVLKKMIDDVTSLQQFNTVAFKFMIRSRENPSFNIDDAIIDILSFDQNFYQNTTDNIQITVNMPPTDLFQLVTNQSGLYANLVIEIVNPTTGSIVLSEKPLTFTYKVFVHDLSTLTKKYGINAFTNTDGSTTPSGTSGAVLVKVDMQLITDTEYSANSATFNGMIRNMNVASAVRYMASVMGIPSLKMIPPDNTQSFQHVIIPPEVSGFRTAFDYLQTKFGVYSNGFRHYITNGMLHVYPPFDMKSTQIPKLHIIRASENTYHGQQNYHQLQANNDLVIVSNTALDSKTLSNVGSENDGNTKLFVRSDGVIDGQVNQNTMMLNNITASMSSTADLSISRGSAVPKYVKPTLNLFEHASTFAETNTELMSMGWTKARIGMIYPGMPTVFIFDEKNVVMSKTGIVEGAKYRYTRQSREMFVCDASLIIRSDPTPVPYNA